MDLDTNKSHLEAWSILKQELPHEEIVGQRKRRSL